MLRISPPYRLHTLKRSVLSRRHRPLPVQVSLFSFIIFKEKSFSISSQHFPTKDAQSNYIIHTKVGISRDSMNPLHSTLSTHYMHLQSVIFFHIEMIFVCIFLRFVP